MNENKPQIFNSEEFGTVRTLTIEGEPYFVGKDVATILGYVNINKAIQMHVDEEDKKVLDYRSFSHFGTTLWNGNDFSNKTIVNESGLYSLILSSKLPNAKKFKRWVTSEILPAIRKHGAYMTPDTLEQALYNPDFLIRLATELKDTQAHVKHLEAKIDNDKPKVIFAKAVSKSKTSILIGDLAKIIKQNGIDIGQKRLFAWLRDNGYLIKRNGSDYNMPTQRSMELGLFEVKETIISRPDGHVTVNKTPKVTGKGQQYFINKFIG